MRLTNIIFLAWRNLWAHRLRAMLTIGGVTLGVGAIVFLVSIGFGLEKLVTSQVANFDAFSTIDVSYSNLTAGRLNSEVIQRIKSFPHVTDVYEIDDLAGRAHLKTQNSTTETVVTAATSGYLALSQTSLDKGRLFRDASINEVTINQSLSALLGFNKTSDALGQQIFIDLVVPGYLLSNNTSSSSSNLSSISATIVGISSGNLSPVLYAPQSLVNHAGVVNRTSLKVRVDDKNNIADTRQAIENLGFTTEYVGDTVSQIDQVFSLFRIILGGFGMIALAVAALGTFNTLTISLMERIREVGLLRTLGMKQKDIFRLFLAESLSIGIIGGAIGIVMATAVGNGINSLLAHLAAQNGAEKVIVYYTPISFIVIVAFGSLMVGFITGFYPAHRAIKMKALDLIRYQ